MTAPNPSTALARVVVDELVRGGVTRFVLAPGSRSAALAFALADHPGVELSVLVDERSAAFHALGAARATGTPAAAVTTSGTAAANLLPAAVEADLDAVPLLLLTADRPPELRDVGANQTIDQVKLLGTSVRWFAEIAAPEDRRGVVAYWRSVAARAVAEARGASGRPGPVHLDLGFREPTVPESDDGRDVAEPFRGDLDGRAGARPWTRFVAPEVAPRPVEDLDGRVLLWAGRPVTPDDLAAGWVVAAEPAARAPGTVSTAHHLLAHPGFADRLGPETVVALGRPGISRPASLALRRASRRITVSPHPWTDPDRVADEVRRVLPRPAAGDPAWREEWLAADAAVRRSLDAALDGFPGPSEPRAARDAARAAAGGVLVVASSMPVRDLDAVMEPGDVTVVSNRGASGIDGFVSTALGVAAASARPVVALAGDLSVLHDANGFLVDPRPDCVFVVVNNDGGGIFSFLPPSRIPGFERLFSTPHGRSFEALAAFHDLGYRKVSRPDELVEHIAAGREAGGVWLVEVRTERSGNVALHRALDATAAAAIDGFLSRGRRSSPRA